MGRLCCLDTDWWSRLRPACDPSAVRMATDMAFRAKSRFSGSRCPVTGLDVDDTTAVAFGGLLLATLALFHEVPAALRESRNAYEWATRGARWLLLALDGAILNPRALSQQTDCPEAHTMRWWYEVNGTHLFV